jgi:two-component system, LytTR family, sensor histidine kinase AgrC
MNVFFLPRPKQPIMYFIWIFYYIFQVVTNTTKIVSPPILLLSNLVLVILISYISHIGSFKKHCTFSILICTIWMLTEIITSTVLNMLGFHGTQLVVYGAAISKLTMFICAIFISHYTKRKLGHDLPYRYVFLMLLVPLGSIFIIHNIFVLSSLYKQYSHIAMTTGIILLIINYVIFEVYEWLMENSETQEKSLLYEQQLELCSRQASEREERNLEIRKLRHDMQNHLVCLLGTIEERNYKETTEYVKKLLETSIDYKPHEVSRSGNIVVDSLINYKCSLAIKEKIEFNTNIFIPIDIPFQNGNLTIILGNLLENALDACKQISEGKRTIDLSVTYSKGILYIIVKNTYINEPIRNRNGIFLTTKKDRINHGLGLTSVEQAIEPYHGEVLYEYKNGIYQATVCLFDRNTQI